MSKTTILSITYMLASRDAEFVHNDRTIISRQSVTFRRKLYMHGSAVVLEGWQIRSKSHFFT